MKLATRHLDTKDARETEALASRLAGHLRPGDIVALDGELGAGKTCFTRGLVQALDRTELAAVASPTYALLNEYPTDPPVYHLDFYRVTDVDDLETTGYWDLVARGDGIVVIEWWRRVPEAVDDSGIFVTLEITADGRRVIFEVPKAREKILEDLG